MSQLSPAETSNWPAKRLRFLVRRQPTSEQRSRLAAAKQVSFLPMEAIGERGEFDVSTIREKEDVATGYSLFFDGDVVIAKITPCFENGKGALAQGLLNGVGFGTTELHVLTPNERVDCRFLYYVAAREPFRKQGEAGMTGAAGQKRVTDEFIKNFRVACPSLAEQKAIARFLDRDTRRLDSLVADKERVLELLAEKRRALIRRAVTRGLNSAAPLRDSGLPWLGQIPAHWKTSAVKYLARQGERSFTDGDWIELPYISSEGIRLIQTGNVGIGHFREQGFRYISEETFAELRCTEVFPKDILICRLDGPVGRACLAPDLGVRMITSVDNTILKVSDGVDPGFVVFLFSSDPWLNWIDSLCRVGGGFRLRISRTMLGDFRIALPRLDEQHAIVAHTAAETAKLDALRAAAEQTMALLKERRAALISAAVTGNIAVSEKPQNL